MSSPPAVIANDYVINWDGPVPKQETVIVSMTYNPMLSLLQYKPVAHDFVYNEANSIFRWFLHPSLAEAIFELEQQLKNTIIFATHHIIPDRNMYVPIVGIPLGMCGQLGMIPPEIGGIEEYSFNPLRLGAGSREEMEDWVSCMSISPFFISHSYY